MPLSHDATLVGGSVATGFASLNGTMFVIFGDPASFGAYMASLLPMLFALAMVVGIKRSSSDTRDEPEVTGA